VGGGLGGLGGGGGGGWGFGGGGGWGGGGGGGWGVGGQFPVTLVKLTREKKGLRSTQLYFQGVKTRSLFKSVLLNTMECGESEMYQNSPYRPGGERRIGKHCLDK